MLLVLALFGRLPPLAAEAAFVEEILILSVWIVIQCFKTHSLCVCEKPFVATNSCGSFPKELVYGECEKLEIKLKLKSEPVWEV